MQISEVVHKDLSSHSLTAHIGGGESFWRRRNFGSNHRWSLVDQAHCEQLAALNKPSERTPGTCLKGFIDGVRLTLASAGLPAIRDRGGAPSARDRCAERSGLGVVASEDGNTRTAIAMSRGCSGLGARSMHRRAVTQSRRRQ